MCSTAARYTNALKRVGGYVIAEKSIILSLIRATIKYKHIHNSLNGWVCEKH